MTQRSLEDFFDALRSSQCANRVIFSRWYAIIERIDERLVRAGKNLINPKPTIAHEGGTRQ
jgi:hypothetical protein